MTDKQKRLAAGLIGTPLLILFSWTCANNASEGNSAALQLWWGMMALITIVFTIMATIATYIAGFEDD